MNPVEDIAYVRIAAPDLDLMARFLSDFGLMIAHRDENRLFMRGCGADPVVHVTERGPVGTIGYAFKVGAHADLVEAAAEFGAVVEQRDEPGGGSVVRLRDPDGNRVELIHGWTPAEVEPVRAPAAFNPAVMRSRHNATIRNVTAPSHIMRLGHVAVHGSDFPAMFAFYTERLGLRVSDAYHLDDPAKPIGVFLRCGLGQRFVDHHTIALMNDGRSGIEHMAFEVLDIDDLMMGNRHLSEAGEWRHSWGIGRHREGSQIFDYWRDPFGNKIEHWTDGDLVNDDYRSGSTAFDPVKVLSQWGPPLSEDFLR